MGRTKSIAKPLSGLEKMSTTSHVLTSLDGIADPYIRRIVSNILNKDPLKIFARTPRRLKKLTKGLKKKELRFSPAPGKWSITEIIAHFADTELVLAFRLRMVLAQSGSPLQAMDQDKWAVGLHYSEAKVDDQLELFSVVRNQHVVMLESLNADDWQKFGMHQERGLETVERITQHYAGHDINHMNQIESIRRLLKKKK